MIKKILLACAALIVILVVAVAMQPSEYRLSRSTTIAAKPADIFPHVNDLRRWDDWSPWAKLDPNATVAFEGPEAGQGAAFTWAGNDKVGAGRMTITDSKPSERITTRTDFVKPFEGSSVSEFTFVAQGNQTEVNQTLVTWTMSGEHNFIGKAMCLVLSMERMLGPDFEKGLAQLKMMAERK